MCLRTCNQPSQGCQTALVLCGGLGTRLRSVIGDLPKVLAPVAGRPFLDYVLGYLRDQGISNLILCTGYDARHVHEFCQNGMQWNMRITYSQESEPLGTGGAIKHAERWIDSDPFWVLNGDSLANADLARQERYHREKNAQITLALVETDARNRFGSVILRGDGAVREFAEKSAEGCGLVSAGIYLMNRSVLDVIPPAHPVSLEFDVFPRFVGKGLFGLVAPGPLIDIGTPESYAAAQALVPHRVNRCES